MSATKYHDRTDLLFDRIDSAEREGLDISLDTYPYLAGSTYLHAMLPSWLQDGGSEGARIRLSDPAQRAKAIHELTVTGSDGAHGGTVNLETVRVAGVENPENLKYVGQYVAKAARSESKNPIDFYLDLILAEDFKASCIIFSGHEGNVRAIMKDRRHMVGSDGILAGNKPHPRAYGTFARYLGHYVREEKVLSLEDAVAHMTGRPAKRLSLKNRGLLKAGYKADLVLFDAGTVLDLATYDDPRHPAAGFETVWIDGIETLANGKRTSHTPGRAIRSSRR